MPGKRTRREDAKIAEEVEEEREAIKRKRSKVVFLGSSFFFIQVEIKEKEDEIEKKGGGRE